MSSAEWERTIERNEERRKKTEWQFLFEWQKSGINNKRGY